jgi:hypothetical protein
MEMIHGIALQKNGEIRQVLVASQDVRQVRRALVAPRGTWKGNESEVLVGFGFIAGAVCQIQWEVGETIRNCDLQIVWST